MYEYFLLYLMGTEATAFAHVYFFLLCFALFRSFDPTRSDVRIFKSARKKRNKSEYFCVNVWPISSTTDGLSNVDLHSRHLVYSLMQFTSLQDRNVTFRPIPLRRWLTCLRRSALDTRYASVIVVGPIAISSHFCPIEQLQKVLTVPTVKNNMSNW